MTKELFPCPCCGSKEVGFIYRHPAIGPSYVWLRCDLCGLRGPEQEYHHGDHSDAMSTARALWNTRTDHEPGTDDLSVDEIIAKQRELSRGVDARGLAHRPASAPPPEVWQPIETAPKDGKAFLGWDHLAEAFVVCKMFDGDSYISVCWNGERNDDLTLWAPIPALTKEVRRCEKHGVELGEQYGCRKCARGEP